MSSLAVLPFDISTSWQFDTDFEDFEDVCDVDREFFLGFVLLELGDGVLDFWGRLVVVGVSRWTGAAETWLPALEVGLYNQITISLEMKSQNLLWHDSRPGRRGGKRLLVGLGLNDTLR